MKYKDIERFFNEWKMTFESDGPFTSEQDLGNLEKAMTDPDDFMVRTLLKSFIEISQWCVGEKKKKNFTTGVQVLKMLIVKSGLTC